MMTVLHFLLAAVALWLIGSTLLNFSRHPHWYVRIWDFPRVQVAALAAAVAVAYVILFHQRWWDLAVLAGLLGVVARQLQLILPYTPLAPVAVQPAARPAGEQSFRLLISNLLQENEQHGSWLEVVRASDPDVIVALELDARWESALAVLHEAYPFRVHQPQDNCYGMAMYSRLRFERQPQVRFIVQEDVPSIHATLVLRDGQRVRLHALHPRPPEPVGNQDSAPRDAELIVLGKDIARQQQRLPTIVCGDLNDVAWSSTTQLFLRLSRLLDPRRGRGPYNSFNAKSRIFRFPLDHVFHSDHFRLIELRVLPFVGSDHFPILIELSLEPEPAQREQEQEPAKHSDHEQAREMVQEQVQRQRSGDEKGHVREEQAHG